MQTTQDRQKQQIICRAEEFELKKFDRQKIAQAFALQTWRELGCLNRRLWQQDIWLRVELLFLHDWLNRWTSESLAQTEREKALEQ